MLINPVLEHEEQMVPEQMVPEPFIYNASQNFTSVKNVLLVDKSVYESELFQKSSNDNTFTIIYSQSSSSDDIFNLLKNNIQTIENLGLIFHGSENELKPFLNNYYLFDKNDLSSTSYSKNMDFIIQLIQTFSIKNIDFLACNTLNYDVWKSYYTVLQEKTSVIVGASNNTTGNILYGGDWILESDNENVIGTYFTNNILSYTGSLATTVSGNVALNQAYFNNAVNWPLTVSANSTITISENIIATNPNNYIIINGTSVTIDGLNHSITITGILDYIGFINNGSTTIYGFSGLTIQNINIQQSGSTLLNVTGNYPSWLCAKTGFGSNSNNVLIQNCYNTGSISGDRTGGICGHSAGYNGGQVTITNCYNTGSISGARAGGICGQSAGYNGQVTITNCYNTGSISGDRAGGICGQAAGFNGGQVTITNCYNTGSISGAIAGGICGEAAGWGGQVTITNCYNTGSISGNYTGGICGPNTGFAYDNSNVSIVTISNCYNAGNFGNYTGNGGICSQGTAVCYFSHSGSPPNSVVNITNCYNLSYVFNSTQGAIFVQEDPNVNPPQNSISVGTVNMNNCYMLYGNAIGVFSNNITGTINQSNILISSNGSWNDTEAISVLTGIPINYDITTTWISVNQNTHYLLSSYNSEIYNPNTATSETNQYTSSAGVFSSSYKIISVNNNENVSINQSNGILTIDSNNINSYTVNVISYSLDANNNYYNYEINDFTLTFNIPNLVCFKEDSKILTNKGYIPIQDLRKGDLVKTLKHDYKAIDMIGKREIYHTALQERVKDQLYKCSQSEYPEIFEPLIITGSHSILVENSTTVVNTEKIEKVIEVIGGIYLTDDKLRLPACVDYRASVYEKAGTYDIYHIALENDNYYMNYGVYANGLLVETCSKRYLKELSNMTLIE